jgi:glutamine amidotransferase
MITIIDYGIGNLGSVQNMLKKVGVENEITNDHSIIAAAKKIIFPGVGAFGPAMEKLREHGMIELLTRKVKQEKVPVLGICLGMQLMTNSSEEGGPVPGLSWIDAHTIRFRFADPSIKVPHKGWNIVRRAKQSKLFTGEEELKFYFDHSYYVKLERDEDQLLSTSYGIDFTSSFQSENIFGVQFHPEKSHRYGMELLENFAKI